MGAARPAPTLDSILSDFTRRFQHLEADLRQRRGFQSTETKPLGTSSGTSSAGITGFLRSAGDQMTGPLALAPSVTFIDNGAINISQELGESYTSYILVNPEGAVNDTLDTILGAAFPGQLATIQNVSNTGIITVSNADNIAGNDIEINFNENITFIFDITGDKWRIWSGDSGGGGSGSQTPWIQPIEGAGFTLNEAGKIVIKPIQTDGLEGILDLIRNDTNPENGDTLGVVFFKGPDSDNDIQTWVTIETTYEEVLAGAKQSQFKINAQKDNALLPIIDYTGDDATFRFSSAVDVVRPNANGSKELGTDSFFWDDVFSETFTLRGSGGNTLGTARTVYADATGMVFNMPDTSPAFTHSVNNKIFSLLTDGDLELRTELPNGFTLRLRNNDQTPTNNDKVADILFRGNNDILDEQTYGAIEVFMSNIGVTSKQAAMSFRSQQNNSLKTWINFLGASDKINIFANLDANFRDILDMGGETINAVDEESVVAPGDDYILMYDASVLALRKVKIQNLPATGGSFLPLAGGTMSGAIAMGGNDISGIDDLFFVQSDTSITTAADIVTHDYPPSGSWRITNGATSQVIFNGSGVKFGTSVAIGFFGLGPLPQQSAPSDTLANLYTILRAYGLIA